MIFRGLDGNGDWTFGLGKQSYATGNNAIALNIATRLKTFYSECFFNTDWGLPWFQLLGQKSSAPLLLTVRSQILDCYGVVSVTDLQTSVDSDRNLLISYNISTIYSTSISGSISL
jgi:hypothetical protein